MAGAGLDDADVGPLRGLVLRVVGLVHVEGQVETALLHYLRPQGQNNKHRFLADVSENLRLQPPEFCRILYNFMLLSPVSRGFAD